MNFNEILKSAPLRTARADFRGLFGLEVVITPNHEIAAAIKGATKEVLDTASGKYMSEIDQDRLRDYLVTRVVGFHGLTLRTAMTLCGRDLPEELAARGSEPLGCDRDTAATLLQMVVGLQTWLLGQLKTLGAEAARREAESLKN
ncbi:MAG: hypothetical protein ACOY32_15115 [Thermodesulfobacteriota bacterium]